MQRPIDSGLPVYINLQRFKSWCTYLKVKPRTQVYITVVLEKKSESALDFRNGGHSEIIHRTRCLTIYIQ